VIGISAPTWVTCLERVGLACSMCGPRRRFDSFLHAVCSGSHNDCLDSHDSVLSLMSRCNIIVIIIMLL
jgi:hypothetical protein